MSSTDPGSPAADGTGPASSTHATRPSRTLTAAIVGAVVVVAVLGYARTGSPRLAGLGSPPASVAAAGATTPGGADGATNEARQRSIEQISGMVDALATRMKERPDDAEGWTMLARSYVILGRFAEALPAYRRASELQPGNAGLLADYADASAASRGTIVNPESERLVAQALAIDPQQPKALALAGTLAFERGDFAGAAARWQKIADQLPPGSEMAQQVQASIHDARQRAAGSAASPGAASSPSRVAAAASAPTAPGAAGGVPTTAGAAAAAVSGTVTLAPALSASAAPDDTVFVFARASEGARMPLAIQRARVADLPLSFTLDDSSAMSPAARLSGAQSVIVAARVSKSGNAMPQPGDLIGESAPLAPGSRGLSIRIDRVVGSR